MSAGIYDVLLYAEHGLYAPALEPKHQIHDRMCVMNKGTLPASATIPTTKQIPSETNTAVQELL